MESPPTTRRALEIGASLGLLFVVSALRTTRQQDIYREDQYATELVTRPVEDGFTFAPPGARVDRSIDGDRVVLADAEGGTAVIRGPVTFAGSATSASVETPDGRLQLVVWDEYDGEVEHGGSFDVLGAFLLDGKPEPAFVIARGPSFQARPTVAFTGRLDSPGEAWVAWEEGPDGWGRAYRSVDQQWNNATDSHGPLHTWRSTRLARIERDGSVTEHDVPMPSFEFQRLQPDRRPGAERVGVFYERPELFSTGEGGLWLAYRHVHQSQAGLQIPKLSTHIERGFAVHVRLLTQGGFGPLYRIDERQRDGEQRIEFRSTESGAELVLETGRADRRKDGQFQGVRTASLTADTGDPMRDFVVSAKRPRRQGTLAAPASVRQQIRPTAVVDGQPYSLFFGDLHRHTDLSLCFPFFDGSLDDAYRYAMGPGALDFVAVTDHARDLDQGKVESRPWQLHVAAADRHHLPGRFLTFRAYERSQAHTDHNVLGLTEGADFLRPHRPPLKDFWAEFPASEVFTIPHATAAVPGQRFCGDVWTKRDDLKRPIAEIYQAFRDVSSMTELQERALLTGQKLGFIASSDHLATSSAYACVWNPGDITEPGSRESLFRSLQSRRCYGSTARIELKLTAAHAEALGPTHWMGEDLPDAPDYRIEVSGRGSAPLERIEYWSNGELLHSAATEADTHFGDEFLWTPPAEPQQYLFVRVIQRDGEQAWSSPFFVRWDSVTSGE
ncbi:hypothetical protein Poly30_46750 [Planctomycetes bacterium Poly30]|uniref:DUF3604 domain-containing protein n=1 Tax=Saltatorellus ferox TaxID=2528018 RepID=A0A518EYF3_9BACT|nr:hypothetical protein Poly30_46750 [Planctomycetes bacterium Poly30]